MLIRENTVCLIKIMISQVLVFPYQLLRNLLFTMSFPTGQERNFNEHPVNEVDFAGGMYDFDSIMHYGNYLYSKNKKMTMVALKNPNLLFGQTLKLSQTDILQINAIYDCKSKSCIS